MRFINMATPLDRATLGSGVLSTCHLALNNPARLIPPNADAIPLQWLLPPSNLSQPTLSWGCQ